ncbi:MAG: hypothetical protein ABIO70_34405 [Pseudomonadota bacterium]
MSGKGLQAITCKGCGGAVAMPAGAPHPRCLFCGSEAVVAEQASEDIEVPGTFLPFEIDAARVREAFQKKARASIWYPGDLRQAKLEFSPLLLPAWTWSGEVETHWAALVPASTRSGKCPLTGTDSLEVRGILVPSSTALTRAELDAIAPYSGEHAFLFRAEQATAPFEIGRLTRSAARDAARQALAGAHCTRLQAEHHASVLHGSHLYRDLEGEPVLLPVYIGAYRRGGRLFRVVINGQTAKLTGEFPISWLRVGCAVIGGLALITGLLLFVGLVLLLLGYLG